VRASGAIPTDPDQPEQKVAQEVHNIRSVVDRDVRNNNADHAGFDAVHGMFKGW
jgi:hypothetical protein